MGKVKLSEDKLRKVQQSYFEAHPNCEQLSFAKDGTCFYTENCAKIYADKHGLECVTVKRSQLSGSENSLEAQAAKEAEEAKAAKEAEAQGADKAKVVAEAELEAFELNEECDWDKIREIGKALGVTGRSKADYIAALAPIKAELLNSETK